MSAGRELRVKQIVNPHSARQNVVQKDYAVSLNNDNHLHERGVGLIFDLYTYSISFFKIKPQNIYWDSGYCQSI